jgi:hypothetical protein
MLQLRLRNGVDGVVGVDQYREETTPTTPATPFQGKAGKTTTYGKATLSATGPTLLPIAEATIFGRVLTY